MTSDPIPVVSLTIFKSAYPLINDILPESQILIAVRDPDTNVRHPNVVSIPTQKVPVSLFRDIQQRTQATHASNEVEYCDGPLVSSTSADCNDPIIYAVRAVFAGKLGLADALERQLVSYRARPATIVTGTVLHPVYPAGIDVEHMSMINLAVGIEEGHSCLPTATASYSRILWTSVQRFRKMIALKDTSCADESLSPIDYCVHGMCIASAQAFVDRHFMVKPSRSA